MSTITLPKNLKRYRGLKNLTMRQVADGVGIAECTYCAYEHGTREPNIEKLKKLAKLYDCTIDDLVGEKKQEET